MTGCSDKRFLSIDSLRFLATKLESLFSSSHAMPMQLRIERAGKPRTYTFQLDVATRVLKANNWRIVDGQMVPLWLPRAYTNCFVQAL
jgi:hypothetical protein